jgi:hypothetical protein
VANAYRYGQARASRFNLGRVAASPGKLNFYQVSLVTDENGGATPLTEGRMGTV